MTTQLSPLGQQLLQQQQQPKFSIQQQTTAIRSPFSSAQLTQPSSFYPDAKIVLSDQSSCSQQSQQPLQHPQISAYATAYPGYYSLLPFDSSGNVSLNPQNIFGVTDFLPFSVPQYVAQAGPLLVHGNASSNLDLYNFSLAQYQQQMANGSVYEVPTYAAYQPIFSQPFGHIAGMSSDNSTSSSNQSPSNSQTNVATSASVQSSSFGSNSAFTFNNTSALASSLFPLGCHSVGNTIPVSLSDNSCLRYKQQLVTPQFVIGTTTAQTPQCSNVPSFSLNPGSLQACRFTPIFTAAPATVCGSDSGVAVVPDINSNQSNFNFSLTPNSQPLSIANISSEACLSSPPKQQLSSMGSPQSIAASASTVPSLCQQVPVHANITSSMNIQQGSMNLLGSVPPPPPPAHVHSCMAASNDDNDSSDESHSTRSSSTSNSNTKDNKFCDCCYCELLGHPTVSVFVFVLFDFSVSI